METPTASANPANGRHEAKYKLTYSFLGGFSQVVLFASQDNCYVSNLLLYTVHEPPFLSFKLTAYHIIPYRNRIHVLYSTSTGKSARA